jgi:23S rRNA (cytidine1920-2'-O)/16S rRNA (cytidine1409-2'-O)-methyltransferase
MLRLDQALVERGLLDSREKARRAIMAGRVRLNGQLADKASHAVRPADQVQLTTPDRYVSRGGFKLEAALREFSIKLQDAVAIDLGASTGGFTDCLLQHGARRVYAVDVGQGQLAWRLRQDPRVVVMEGRNARHLTRADFPSDFTGASPVVIDCSFISLAKLLPAAASLLAPDGTIVALVKPQFEAGREEADRGAGVITDPAVHQRVLDQLRTFVDTLPALRWHGLVDSPLLGPAGNKEFLLHLQHHA